MIDHHAVLYITESSSYLPHSISDIEATFESSRFFIPTLSIKDVRIIIDRAYQMPFASAQQYILINTDSIPIEAQNALLKILEEPPVTTRFILMVRPQTVILPTLRSRLMSVGFDTEMHPNPVFTNFLQSSVPDRLLTIAQFAKDKNDISFQELYRGLLKHISRSVGTQKSKLAPHVSYLLLRGASKKMIWEDIALLLPVGLSQGEVVY